MRDGGYRSRKLWFTVFAMGLAFAGFCLTAGWPAFAPSYSTFVGAIVGLSTVYLTSNVATKAVLKPPEPTK